MIIPIGTPPHTNSRNAAEQAIHTWENNLIVGLCSVGNPPPPHVPIVLHPQKIPDHIEHIEARNIK